MIISRSTANLSVGNKTFGIIAWGEKIMTTVLFQIK